MNPPVLGEAAVVDVPVDVCCHVRTRREDIPEFLGVDQSAWEVERIAAETRVMVGDDEHLTLGNHDDREVFYNVTSNLASCSGARSLPK